MIRFFIYGLLATFFCALTVGAAVQTMPARQVDVSTSLWTQIDTGPTTTAQKAFDWVDANLASKVYVTNLDRIVSNGARDYINAREIVITNWTWINITNQDRIVSNIMIDLYVAATNLTIVNGTDTYADVFTTIQGTQTLASALYLRKGFSYTADYASSPFIHTTTAGGPWVAITNFFVANDEGNASAQSWWLSNSVFKPQISGLWLINFSTIDTGSKSVYAFKNVSGESTPMSESYSIENHGLQGAGSLIWPFDGTNDFVQLYYNSNSNSFFRWNTSNYYMTVDFIYVGREL